MNLTYLLRKPAKAFTLLAMLAVVPMVVQAESQPTTMEQLTYEPQLDNQRDPNQYCAKCHKFDKVDKTQTLDQSGGELHFGKFHGAHLNQKNPNNGKPINCVNCHGNISEDHVVVQKMLCVLTAIFLERKNQCIAHKNKTKYVSLATNRKNFVKNFGRMMFMR